MNNSRRQLYALRKAFAIGVVGVLAVLPAACSSSSTTGASSTTSAGVPCKKSDGPVKLTYWTWGAGYDKVVKLWNEKHPNIQVEFSSIPGGSEGGYTKMFNAAKAKASPDLGFIEFDTLPAFRSQDAIMDISNCLTKAEKSAFVPTIWDQVKLGDTNGAYALPLNSGPMVMYYRKDLFEKYGLSVPTTWDEFALDAAKLRKGDPSSYLTNFSPSSANWFAALSSQRGANWFSFDGTSWTVNLNDSQTETVANYWQKLIDSKQVSTVNSFTPEWTSMVAKGQILTWISAAWGAGIIKSSAPDSSGDWAVAPMPRWSEGTQSANWGGGALSVFKGSLHPYEAAQFAYWVGNDPEAMKILKDAIGIYPVSKTLLESPEFKKKDPYFGGQVIFDDLSQATANLAPVTWGPSMSTTYAAISDAFSSSLAESQTGLSSALKQAQTKVLENLKRQGIPTR